MEQEKIAKLIKDIRKKNNLTQKGLADKLGVTYQAVSKWENEKNIPDIAILKKISELFNINIDDLLNGEYSNKNSRKIITLSSVVLACGVITFIALMFYLSKDNDFTFKTLSTGCEDFTISGSIAYNENKSSIYISEVKYCGGDDSETYSNINCSLYEEIDGVKTLITSCDMGYNTTLENFFETAKLSVDDYKQNCKNYISNNLYLEIIATDDEGNNFFHRVDLNLEDNCKF